jgi:predicted DNA-binding transcriptional regulator YafY
MLVLIPRLTDGTAHRLDELARAVGTDRGTLVRDIETLVSRPDDPGGFVPGVQIYFTGDEVSLTSTQFHRPMRLTSSELGALEIGLAVLRTEHPPDERPSMNRALDRLRLAMVDMPSDAIAAGQREASLPDAGDPSILATLQRAMEHRRKIGMTYRGGDRTESSERTVCPYALVIASGHWFLLGHCESRNGVLSFRVDRIEAAGELDESYEIPATFSVDEYLNDRKVLRPDGARSMRVRYSPRIARWIAEREGVEPEADGSLTLEHPLLDVQWGVRHVLQYGPDAEVVEPAEVREEIARRLGALVDHLVRR